MRNSKFRIMVFVMLVSLMTGFTACGRKTPQGGSSTATFTDSAALTETAAGREGTTGMDTQENISKATVHEQTNGTSNKTKVPTIGTNKNTTSAAATVGDNPHGLKSGSVRLLGRQFYDAGTDATYFSFTNSGFELTFTGKRLQAELVADVESVRHVESQPYLSIYVNNMEHPAQVYCMNQREATLILFESQKVQTVMIRVLKRSEASCSSIGVRRLIADQGGKMVPTAIAKRRMVFIGDSYTCGFGNEGAPDQMFNTRTENGCDTYAARAARAFRADFHCICWSGIGVRSSYTETNQPNTELLMKDLYPKTDYAGYRRLLLEQKPYDFSQFQPDVVVINLGTNDSSYTARAGEAAREEFKRSYEQLLSTIRDKNPRAAILCTLGPLGTETEKLYTRIHALVDSRNAAGDSRIFAMSFAKTQSGEGLGTADHPSMKTHIRMAGELQDKLEEILGWK